MRIIIIPFLLAMLVCAAACCHSDMGMCVGQCPVGYVCTGSGGDCYCNPMVAHCKAKIPKPFTIKRLGLCCGLCLNGKIMGCNCPPCKEPSVGCCF